MAIASWPSDSIIAGLAMLLLMVSVMTGFPKIQVLKNNKQPATGGQCHQANAIKQSQARWQG